MKMVLLRVGSDSGCPPLHSNGPLLSDGRFEFVPIPDLHSRNERRTYGNTIGRTGRPLADYFPGRRAVIRSTAMHVDPEFDTWTYGTPTRMQHGLTRLERGDMLAFYAGLRPVGDNGSPLPGGRHSLYLVGYFEVECGVRAREHARDQLLSTFGENFHVRHEDIFERDHANLVLVKGGPGSRLLTRAAKISDQRPNRRGRPTFVLSDTMRDIFGALTGGGFIERSSPRWIAPELAERSAVFVRSLP